MQALASMYAANATLIWDGHPYAEATAIRDFFTTALPISKHEVLSLDVQPISASADANAPLLITVTGDVKFGMKEQNHGFVHTFVIIPDATRAAGNFFSVQHAMCRTHKATLKSAAAQHQGARRY
jgi:hypothetical protein